MADGFDELDAAFERMLQRFPQARRELVERAGDKMYAKVIRNIETDVKEKTGTLKRGVTKAIGSKGGYAAVRNDYKIAKHAYILENGHEMIVGAARKKGGRSVGWVPGKHMYRNALNELADELTADAEEMLERWAGEGLD